MKKIYNLFYKYGGVLGPFNVLKWQYKKLLFKGLSLSVAQVDRSCFRCKRKGSVWSLYKGDNSEYDLISKGRRQILSYQNLKEFEEHDIKIRWERNRLHHLPVLAKCAENKDYETLRTQLNTTVLDEVFHETNGMEVGISAINIIVFYQNLTPTLQDEFEGLIGAHLRKCLIYILKNIERGVQYSANHYFFNLIGVLWICENLPDYSALEKVRKTAHRDLKKLLNQFLLPDGSLYEGSTYYHKYVTESLLLFIFEFNNRYTDILYYANKMVGFLKACSHDQGVIGIGDNDSGRLLALPRYFGYNSCDINLITELTEKIGLKVTSSVNSFSNRKNNFGLYKVVNNQWKVFLRLEEGKRKFRRSVNAHCHNDQLEILILYENEAIVIPKGTFSYTKFEDHRIEALKTSSHNTLFIEGFEQNEIWNGFGLLRSNVVGELEELNSVFIKGKLNYRQLGVSHTRVVGVTDKAVEVVDSLDTSHVSHVADTFISYRINPKFSVLPTPNPNEFILRNNYISFLFSVGPVHEVQILNSYFSQDYGQRQECKVIRISLDPRSGRINIVKVKLEQLT